MEENNNKIDYCLVKYSYWECTGKYLQCKDCVMECEHKKSIGGDVNDQPTN